jgi:DNA transposition AAA+ family ATPase
MSEQIEQLPDAGEISPLRLQVQELVRKGVKQTEIALGAGLAYGTFTLWFSGKYTGNNARIEDAVERYLASRAARAASQQLRPAAPGYFSTPTAEAIIGVLEHGQVAADIVAITAVPGVGKTETVKHYRATRPNVWVVTAQPLTSSPGKAVRALATAMGITESGAAERAAAIIERARGSGGLIIVDEAQHLLPTAIDQLRSMHDAAGIGLALVGSPLVRERLGGTNPNLAQLYSRVGMRLRRDRPLAGDVAALIAAWGIEGDAERKLVTAIARKPGALRGATKVLQMAGMLAQGGPIAAEHITTAWSQISEQPIGEGA